MVKKTKVKNEWSYTSIPLYAFMAWTGTTLLFCKGKIIPMQGWTGP